MALNLCNGFQITFSFPISHKLSYKLYRKQFTHLCDTERGTKGLGDCKSNHVPV